MRDGMCVQSWDGVFRDDLTVMLETVWQERRRLRVCERCGTECGRVMEW